MQLPASVELQTAPDQPTDGCKLNSNPITTKRFYLPPTKRMKQTSGQNAKENRSLELFGIAVKCDFQPRRQPEECIPPTQLHSSISLTISSCKVVRNRNSWIIERLFPSPFLPTTKCCQRHKTTEWKNRHNHFACGGCGKESVRQKWFLPAGKENREKD